MRQDLNLVRSVLALTALSWASAACGGDTSADDDRPTVVVTTNILGQIVGEVLGDAADVEVIMPIGADPHEFEPSARQAEAIEAADLLVINGAGFEEGMADLIEQAEADGTPLFDAAAQVDVVDGDPHVWMDPLRVATIVDVLRQRLDEVAGVEDDGLGARFDGYVRRLAELDTEIATMIGSIPPERRVLVTNHEVLEYFATRYGMEVIGAVIPSLSSGAQPSAGELEALAAAVEAAGVPAIFAETTRPTELAEALASEVGGTVEVVELYTESLGEPGSGAESYVDMMRLDAELITAALK